MAWETLNLNEWMILMNEVNNFFFLMAYLNSHITTVGLEF